MIPFSHLLSSIGRDGNDFTVSLSPDWLQGRTAYGGLSAALCLEAATRYATDLPPLRSAQFSFIGPAAGQLTITPSVLRKGKSTIFMGVDVTGEAGLATRAILCFGMPRPSALDHENIPAPDVLGWDESPSFFGDRPAPNFSQHFESRIAGGARPMTPDAEPEMLLWFRHRDADTPDNAVALVALADAPPPAAMVLFSAPAPISTMTWTLDMLTDKPSTTDGRWLIRSAAETAQGGYSSQAMNIWNADGKPILVARQNVAIFF
ncbi:MAG: thioesterase family protein [Parvibaculaceae bacterium]|nr:thioesterase family protein [Parvibaculaceae bacterium]